ncbi:hypothetical protein TrCOL_g13557 [Triparma columacea]|uniref:WW domain-containing protein n=1 Tax=Triparma columacea TaxID=722753 RepID=A0A9W7GNY0_9STRA|nr:hypothetical protein TrCOL_g13557 [Triparma columacea]
MSSKMGSTPTQPPGRPNRAPTTDMLVDMLVKDRVNQGLSAFPAGAVKRSQKRASQPFVSPPPELQDVTEETNQAAEERPLPEGWEIVAGEDGQYYYNAELQKSQWHHPDDAPDFELDLLDPSMVFSMERTVLSAYNQSFQLMVVGGGIMAVQNANEARNDSRPVAIGFIFFIAGVMYGAMSLFYHIRRMHVLKHGDNYNYNWQLSSIIWMSFLGLFLVVGLSIEVYFAFLFPYIERTTAVEIASPSPTATPVL